MSRKIENTISTDEVQMNGSSPAPESDAKDKRVDPEVLAKLDAIRQRIHATFGQVSLAMMNLPRYRHQSLADLTHLILDPLSRDRIAIASARNDEGKDATAGIAIWASVSDEVHEKIREQIKAGVFPLRLNNEDWVSGDKIWLLEVISPTRKLATAVLANFRQVAKDSPVHVHPIVSRAVDPDILEKLKAAPAADAPAAAESTETVEETAA